MCMLLLLTLVVFFVVTLFGHIAHWSLHQKWMGRFAKSHMTHHLKLYPVDDFYSESYRSAGKDSTVIAFAFLSLPLLALPFVACFFGLLSFTYALVAAAEMLFLGWLHDYVHDSFHVTGHWLRKVPLVNMLHKDLERLHFFHHVDMKKNFGIVIFWWDKVFGSLKRN